MNILKKLKAIRGAVCCENTEESIYDAVCSLYSLILKKNSLLEKDIVSIQFTLTQDINALNPASSLRKKGFAESIPLFCSVEPTINGGLPKTIRILIHCYSRKKAFHVYTGGAEVLRPDLSNTSYNLYPL